jgi:hypothetical protein
MRRSSPTLTDEQQVVARRLLDYVRAEIERFAQGDADAAFRIRRWVHARLQLDNRPPRALQKRKFDQQNGMCPECDRAFTALLGLPLHRIGPGDYAIDNTVLVHPECHVAIHRRGAGSD